MKRGIAAVSVLALLTILAGCGSGTSAPLSLRCSTQRLASGAIRAAVTVTNDTDAPQRAFLYGQPMPLIVHEYPVFATTAVKVTVPSGTYSFIGLAIPRIPPHKKRQLLLRFTPPRHPRSLVVSTTPAIHADDWTVLDNPKCIIRPRT